MVMGTISYKEPKIMLSLYQTLVRPHVEYCSCAWNPHYRKDKELLERIQRRFTKMINDMNGKTNEDSLDRLRCLRPWTLEGRRNRQDLIEVFKMYRGFSINILLHKLFILDTNSKGTRGHTRKLVKTRCNRDITKYFFQARSLIGGICWTNAF